MATQQLMFDILANAAGAERTFDQVASSAEGMADGLGSSGEKAGKNLFGGIAKLAAGGAVVAGVGKAFSDAMDWDSMTSAMTASLNLAAPAAEAAGSAAGGMYAAGYGESMEEVTAAVGATLSSISGMSDASQADIESMSGKLMDLSTAFEVDVSRAAQVAGQMITTGLATDGTNAADLLTATLSKVPQALQGDVMDAIDEYGPMFAQLGFSGGEAMTMLADASAQGAYGIDKAGDALKELTIRASDGSKASSDAMKSLGLDAAATASQIAAGGPEARTAMEEIANGLAGISDPALQAQTAIALFGTPLEDLGTENIPKFIESILNSQEALGTVEGSADALGEKLHSGPGAAMTELKRTVETTMAGLAADMLPTITPILEGLQQFGPILGPVLIALAALAGIVAVVNAVMVVYNATLLLSPMTWIVLGVMALVAALVVLLMNWESVVAWISQVWGGFVNWLQEIVGGFVNWWNELWGGFANWIVGVWQGFIGLISAAWTAYVALITGVVLGFVNWWNEVWGGFANWIVGVWQGFIGLISAAWTAYVALITGVVLGFVNWWNEVWGGFANWIVGLWQGFTAGLSALWSGFVAWIQGVVAGFVGFLVGAFQGVVGTAMAVWSGLGGFFSRLWGGITGGVSAMVGGIAGILGGIPGSIMGVFSGAVSWLWDAGRNVVQGLMNGVRSLAGRIGSFFLDLLPGWIVKPFKIALGIHSPSRVFAGFGQNLGEGVLIGVGRMQHQIDDRMANLVTVPDLPSIDGGTVGPGDGADSAGPAAAGGGTGIDRTTPALVIENLNVSEASAGSWQGMGNQILQAAQVQAPRVFA